MPTLWRRARLLCQTRFLPLPAAISSIERPVAAERGSSSKMSCCVRSRLFILAFDEKPVLVTVAVARAHAHEVPAAAQFFAVEHEIEVTFGISPVRIAFGKPASAIPDHHRAAAIFALRNGAFERVVFDRMVFDMDGKALFGGVETRAARDRPAFHDAVEFETEVIMQPTRGMLLDDITVAAAGRLAAARLRGDIKFPFPAVYFERHVNQLACP